MNGEYVGWVGGLAETENENESKHGLFIQMSLLTHPLGQRSTGQWNQVARWVKYEEDVEECGMRWSKPFIPTIPHSALSSLIRLAKTNKIAFVLDHEPIKTLSPILHEFLDHWISTKCFDEGERESVFDILKSPQSHLFQHNQLPFPMNKKKKKLKVSDERRPSFVAVPHSSQNQLRKFSADQSTVKGNIHFMKKLESGSEAFVILVGELECLKNAEGIGGFLRYSQSVLVPNLAEVTLPTKFLFVLLCPQGCLDEYEEMGRGIASAMLNSKVKDTLNTMKEGTAEFVQVLEEYLNSTTLLPPPPGWDSTTRIEPQPTNNDEEEEEDIEGSGLERTGRAFGGLVNDVKRKIPWYLSDFVDGFSLQGLATWLFLYFACLTPIITFGGLLGEATHEYMGTMETIVGASICGISFALFGGQPLLILGPTGPMLVFEKILVAVCDSYPDLNLNYLELRLWVGIWVTLTLLLLVALDASALVAFITKFTEENFATLISIIFILEAFKNLIHIRTISHESAMDNNSYFHYSLHIKNNSTTQDEEMDGPSALFLFSILLFITTFFISFSLKEFRFSPYLSTRIRYLVSDFGVVIGIVSMSCLSWWVGLAVPRLVVPHKFQPTREDRNWIVHPFGSNPTWTIFAAIIPALLASILVFMDQQITAVIINRKTHKLKKGGGYHLDLFVLSLLIFVNSFLGLPWLVAATVESMTNLGSLKIESESAAPGEKPRFLGVRENRLTNLMIYSTVGFSVFLTPALGLVPMPVLYGVFLYMGFSALRKMDLFDRVLLMLKPTKHQPDHLYIRLVPINKIHLFTLVQISCLVLLWIIKSIRPTAILFPIMLVVMMGVRKLLEFVFTQKELGALDDILPSSKKRQNLSQSTDPIANTQL